MKLANALDFAGYQARNIKIDVLTTDPTLSASDAGRVWINSTTWHLKLWDGSTTRVLAIVSIDSAAPNGSAGGDLTGTYPNPTLSATAAVEAIIRANRLDQFAIPTADISVNAHKLTNVANGSSSSDGVNKGQLDAAVAGLTNKLAARVAFTTNQALTGLPTDGSVSTVDGDTVLLVGQTTASQNGPWVVHSGAWTRPAAFPSAGEAAGSYVFVEDGTNKNKGYTVQGSAPITIDTTAQTWVQFTGLGEVTSGAGLTKTGDTLDVGAGTGITVNADNVAVDTSLTARWKTFLIGDGSSSTLTVNHALGNQYVHVQIFDASTGLQVFPDVTLTDANNVSVAFGTAPASNAYRAVVVG